jgi:protein arginine kinase
MPRANRDDRRRVLQQCRETIVAAGLSDRLMWIDLHEASPADRTLLVERHLISRQHAAGTLSSGRGGLDEPRAVAVGLPSERMSIMVNEEDHLRVQMIHSGLDLAGALAEADAVDDRLESSLDFAFGPRFGYLTACPTNVGTGARLSVMLHLPGLRMTGELGKVKHATDDMGLAMRGFHGEGSDGTGDLYQISNQVTLGKAERVLLEELEGRILPQIINYELAARRVLTTQRRDSTADDVHRALGVLLHAQMLTAEESMRLLSSLRLGVVTGLVRGISASAVNFLMLLVQAGHLQGVVGRELSQRERRIERATLVRDRLAASMRQGA